MVGEWFLTGQEVFESFVTQIPMKLGKPTNISGPGCATCGRHWMDAKDERCVGSQQSI